MTVTVTVTGCVALDQSFGGRIVADFIGGSVGRHTAIRPIDDVDLLYLRDGRWRATPIVALPGAPMGFKVLDGRILVVTMQDVAAITANGSVQLLPCR